MSKRSTTMKTLFISGITAGAILGCGVSTAPKELMSARDAVNQAKRSSAAKLAPVQLEEAKQALAQANQAFKDDADKQDIRDLSYLAQRKAQLAVSAGSLEQAKRDVEQADEDKDAAQEALISSANNKLDKTKEELEAERLRREREQMAAEAEKRRLREAAKKGQAEVERVKKQLEKERKARAKLEKQLAAAMESLAEVAQVKEEKRGVVITMSGAVLFSTGKHKLLPIAKEKLNDVAKAVKDQGYKKVVVEGHTDSRGSPADNEALSLKRAQEVRNYLVTRGIEADKIRAVGHGERRPIATNDTPEGRANNRRVELVVTPE